MAERDSRLAIFPSDNEVDVLYAHFFPTETEQTYAMEFASATIPGTAMPVYQWVGGQERPFPLTLLFDDERPKLGGSSPVQAKAWLDRNVPPFDPGPVVGGQIVARFRPVFTITLFQGYTAFEVLIRRVQATVEQYRKGGDPSRLRLQIDAVRFESLIYEDPWRRSTFSSLRPDPLLIQSIVEGADTGAVRAESPTAGASPGSDGWSVVNEEIHRTDPLIFLRRR